MNLHNFKEEFYDLVKATSEYYQINQIYVEKNYYVFLLLK